MPAEPMRSKLPSVAVVTRLAKKWWLLASSRSRTTIQPLAAAPPVVRLPFTCTAVAGVGPPLAVTVIWEHGFGSTLL